MGKEETRAALRAMASNAEVAAAVEKGDFSSLDAGDLTPAEQALLTAAASELDDTSGFGANVKYDAEFVENWKINADALKLNRPRLGRVLDYLKIGD